MKLPPLAAADLDDLKDLHLEKRTPLWFYVLREADVVANGEHLGPVGGRIVADWEPTYGHDGSFTVVDLLKAADVVATLP